MASKKINYTTLDFDEQKASLKSFLSGQTIFQDYDFEGSGLSVLLDILTFNTHYNSIYNNLSINEMFLDSARKRNSVVSIAKELGYKPNSAVCARAIVDITINSPSAFALAINSPFLTVVDGNTYGFYLKSALLSTSTDLSYTFSNVEIIEMSNILTYTYTVGSGVVYTIPNKNVDLSTLSVSVQGTSGASNITIFTLADNLVDVTNTSNVYWVKEIDDGLYELVFGNGIIGSTLSSGNIVTLRYGTSSLDAPNGAKLFSYRDPNVSIMVKSAATGGKSSEDIESIRFNAPRAYSAQNRGVTTNDYKALIYSNFPAAKSVSVWGGENNIPPVYGKTFICIKPNNGDVLTTAQREYILSTLLPSKNVVTIIPVIVDPEYIDIRVTCTVYYNDLDTNRTPDTIRSIVQDAILAYDSQELQKFDGVFRFSKLSKLIDECEESIVSNITTVTLKREITPKYNIISEYYINLINPIYYSGAAEDIILSSGFYLENSTYIHYVVDDGLGTMKLFYVDDNNNRIYINNNIGYVDYVQGIIKFSDIKISAIVGAIWYLYIKPSSNDVVSALTQIVQISRDDLEVNVISDKTASGDLRGGTNYVFTTSRI